jgi:glycosyltransferase involved in cell wall biosynthesis
MEDAVAAPLRLGINLLYLAPGETGGTEVYARHLVPELAALRPGEPISLFVAHELADELKRKPWCDEQRVVELPVSGRTRVRRVGAEQTLLPLAVRRAKVTVLHSLATTAPAIVPAKNVVTLHDLTYKRFPETHKGMLARGMSLLVPLAARRSTRIIASANAVRDDLVEFLGTPPDKIDVVYHGPGAEPTAAPTGEEELRERLGLGTAPIVFSPSAKRAHKNLSRLIDAFGRIRASPEPTLVIPGYATGMEGRLQDDAEAAGVADRVRFTGWLSQEDFEGLYRAAAFTAFPSLAEGFGFPVVEAMRRGAPVMISNVPTLVEVAAGAGLVVDPLSADDMASGMERLLADDQLRDRLRQLGLERVKELSWRRTAELTLASYRRALGEASAPGSTG